MLAEEPLSILEAEELGLETTVLMAKARESFVKEKIERGVDLGQGRLDTVYGEGQYGLQRQSQSTLCKPKQRGSSRSFSSPFRPWCRRCLLFTQIRVRIEDINVD